MQLGLLRQQRILERFCHHWHRQQRKRQNHLLLAPELLLSVGECGQPSALATEMMTRLSAVRRRLQFFPQVAANPAVAATRCHGWRLQRARRTTGPSWRRQVRATQLHPLQPLALSAAAPLRLRLALRGLQLLLL